MPRSIVYFPDVNVWVALASRRHAHHTVASRWMEGIESSTVSFCRLTQIGLLRLLTNEAVMKADVITQVEAWRVFDRFLQDDRIAVANEPAGIESIWRRLSHGTRSSTNLWTDTYLAACSIAGGFTLVTFDRALASVCPGSTLLAHT